MNESTAKLLDKSTRAIAAGESLLTGGHIDAAARTEYAVSTCARAGRDISANRGIRPPDQRGIQQGDGGE